LPWLSELVVVGCYSQSIQRRIKANHPTAESVGLLLHARWIARSQILRQQCLGLVFGHTNGGIAGQSIDQFRIQGKHGPSFLAIHQWTGTPAVLLGWFERRVHESSRVSVWLRLGGMESTTEVVLNVVVEFVGKMVRHVVKGNARQGQWTQDS
jgi:hypothetical protein